MTLMAQEKGTAATVKATHQDIQRGMKPEECTPKLACTCYMPHALIKIADRIQDAEFCELKLVRLNSQLNVLEEAQFEASWYQDPYFVVGGIVVSVAVGGVVGYFLSK